MTQKNTHTISVNTFLLALFCPSLSPVVVASAENTPSVAVDSFPFPYYTHTPPPPSAVVVQAYSQYIPCHSLSLGNLLVAAHSNLRREVYDHGTRVLAGSENGAVCMVGYMDLVV